MSRPKLDRAALEQAFLDQDLLDAKLNMERFLERRAQGKSCYTAGGGTRFWLTEEGLAERRAEGKTMEPIDIDYKEGEAQDCWHPPLKKASIADIEAMLATGKPIVLYNC